MGRRGPTPLNFRRLVAPKASIGAVTLVYMSTLLQSDLHSEIEKIPVSKDQMRVASDAALALGFLSIAASIVTWFLTKGKDKAHSERFGIFIGLWVPSFFILADHLARRAESE